MATSKQKKQDDLEQITNDLQSAKGIVFASYSGMTVKEIDKVRKNLRKENVQYQVMKITLLKKAMEKLGINYSSFKYSEALAVAMSNDEETTPARVLKGLTKDNPKLIIDGGIFNKEVVGNDIITKLASLPTKEQLLGQLLSVLNGPARGLVTVLSGNTRNLLNVLNAIKDKKAA